MIKAAITALGDQVQEACVASGLDIVGFTIIVNNPDEQCMTTEHRTRATREEYIGALSSVLSLE